MSSDRESRSTIDAVDGPFEISEEMQLAARRELHSARTRELLFRRIAEPERIKAFSNSAAVKLRFASRASYYKFCKAALIRALAPYWRGGRSGLKQFLRTCLHRYRQDVGILRGMLRAAVAPGTLALVMLILSADAHAENCGFHYEPIEPKSSNPLVGGAYWLPDSRPVFCNLDGDQDSDVVVIEADGNPRYFEHTGAPTRPIYTERLGTENPFTNLSLGELPTPSFGDLDQDVDDDMVVGGPNGEFRYFENTGSSQVPTFVERTGASNPFDGEDVGQNSAPSLADMDDDGDLDAVSGNYQGYIFYLKNTGTAQAGDFVKQPNTIGSTFYSLSMQGGETSPCLGDIDEDGDIDILTGSRYGVLQLGRNIGTPQVASFEISSTFFGQFLGQNATPTFSDMDADGDKDALVGSTIYNVALQRPEGKIAYFRNTGTPQAPVFGTPSVLGPLSGATSGGFGNPGLVDIDSDGDLDLFIGDYNERISFYRNDFPEQYNGFSTPPPEENPLLDVNLGERPDPQFADLNGDSIEDAIIGNSDGNLFFLKNVGTETEPEFQQQTGASNPFEGIDVGDFCTPALADLDEDDDFDIIAGDGAGGVHYFRNTGTPLAPIFEEQSGANNPADGIVTQGANNPALADINSDGLVDLVLGVASGRAIYFKNIGTSESPRFAVVSERANPFTGVNVGYYCAPAIGDIDSDGTLDAVFSNEDGRLAHFVPVPSDFFAERNGGKSALTGLSFSAFSAPAVADIDDDSDQDLVVRSTNGVLRYLENTGTPEVAAFTERTGTDNPFKDIVTGDLNVPRFADLDDDGDKDFISCGNQLLYFKNIGNPQSGVFEQQLGASNPLEAISGYEMVPAFADMDADGDLDIFVGSYELELRYFENTGTSQSPTFSSVPTPSQFTGVELDYNSATELSDLDSDGDVDLLVGRDGHVEYYENIGSPEEAQFLKQPGGLASYLANLYTGTRSTPACADMDNDGDVDAFVGAVGSLRYYEHLPPDCEPPTAVCGQFYFALNLLGEVTVSGFAVGADSIDNIGILNMSVSPNYFTCSEIGEHPVTLTVEDFSGNQATCDTTLAIADSNPIFEIADGTDATCGVPYQERAPFAFGVCGTEYPVEVTGTVDTSTPGPYLITYTATNSYGDTTSTSKTVTVSDTQGPVIAAVNPVTVSCAEPYVDVPPGATDLCEGDVPVQTAGSVDTAIPGQYTLTYTAVDSVGNQASQVTRTVTVLNNCNSGGASYSDVIQDFAELDANDDALLTLGEIQALLPGFSQESFDSADSNNDDKLSVAELLQALGGGFVMSADTNGDRVIQLGELLRLIQLYNAGRYYCAEKSGSTEDGFATTAPTNEPNCVPHSSDRNSDKIMSLSELLRGIQFFNLGGYTYCEDVSPEDGFCSEP